MSKFKTHSYSYGDQIEMDDQQSCAPLLTDSPVLDRDVRSKTVDHSRNICISGGSGDSSSGEDPAESRFSRSHILTAKVNITKGYKGVRKRYFSEHYDNLEQNKSLIVEKSVKRSLSVCCIGSELSLQSLLLQEDKEKTEPRRKLSLHSDNKNLNTSNAQEWSGSSGRNDKCFKRKYSDDVSVQSFYDDFDLSFEYDSNCQQEPWVETEENKCNHQRERQPCSENVKKDDVGLNIDDVGHNVSDVGGRDVSIEVPPQDAAPQQHRRELSGSSGDVGHPAPAVGPQPPAPAVPGFWQPDVQHPEDSGNWSIVSSVSMDVVDEDCSRRHSQDSGINLTDYDETETDGLMGTGRGLWAAPLWCYTIGAAVCITILIIVTSVVLATTDLSSASPLVRVAPVGSEDRATPMPGQGFSPSTTLMLPSVENNLVPVVTNYKFMSDELDDNDNLAYLAPLNLHNNRTHEEIEETQRILNLTLNLRNDRTHEEIEETRRILNLMRESNISLNLEKNIESINDAIQNSPMEPSKADSSVTVTTETLDTRKLNKELLPND